MSTDSRQNPVAEATALLTNLPVPENQTTARPAEVAAWFPFVGVVYFGAAAVVVMLGGALLGLVIGWSLEDGLGRLSWLFAAVIVGLWALLSRFIHWDGLADVSDAYWGGGSRERRLEIMKDSSVGSFALIAVVLIAVLQISALGAVASVGGMFVIPVLLCTPLFGRLAATFAAWFGTPARSNGLGSRYNSRPTLLSVLVVLVTCSIAGIGWAIEAFSPWAWAIFIVVALTGAALIPHLLAKRFGGVTGDVMGASILMTETTCLIVAALVAGM